MRLFSLARRSVRKRATLTILRTVLIAPAKLVTIMKMVKTIQTALLQLLRKIKIVRNMNNTETE
jgi:hypothetical protein